MTTKPETAPATIEDVYGSLADAVDAAGPSNEALFLSKVALLLANAPQDHDRSLALIIVASRNLDNGIRKAVRAK